MMQEKQNRKTPTPRQRNAARAIIENQLSDKPLHTGKVLANVGYGTIIQDPKRIIESEGFQEALAETGLLDALKKQGINPKRIASKIDVLLNATKGEDDDYTAIDKGLKHATAIYGIVDDTKKQTNNTYNFIFSKQVQQKVHVINEDIKKLLRQPKDVE